MRWDSNLGFVVRPRSLGSLGLPTTSMRSRVLVQHRIVSAPPRFLSGRGAEGVPRADPKDQLANFEPLWRELRPYVEVASEGSDAERAPALVPNDSERPGPS